MSTLSESGTLPTRSHNAAWLYKQVMFIPARPIPQTKRSSTPRNHLLLFPSLLLLPLSLLRKLPALKVLAISVFHAALKRFCESIIYSSGEHSLASALAYTAPRLPVPLHYSSSLSKVHHNTVKYKIL